MTSNHCEWEMCMCPKRYQQWDVNGHGTGGAVWTSLVHRSVSLADGVMVLRSYLVVTALVEH